MFNRNFLVGCGIGGGGHRFFRVLVNASAGSNYVNIYTLEFREVSGVSQQATGGTASAGGTGSVSPADAFDLDGTTTAWFAGGPGGGAAGSWIQYEFPRPMDIKEVYIHTDGVTTFRPSNVDILSSADGVDWTVVKDNVTPSYVGFDATINL